MSSRSPAMNVARASRSASSGPGAARRRSREPLAKGASLPSAARYDRHRICRIMRQNMLLSHDALGRGIACGRRRSRSSSRSCGLAAAPAGARSPARRPAAIPARPGARAARRSSASTRRASRRRSTGRPPTPSASVAVYRHGCLAGESRLDPLTRDVPFDGWSMTKTVTAMLVGRAVDAAVCSSIDRPIRRLYPEADRAHGTLTPRHLLTMTSGLHRNWVRDLSPQPDRVRDALSLPFDHRPGTHWEYQQSTVTLLANAVERAVGSRPPGVGPGRALRPGRDRRRPVDLGARPRRPHRGLGAPAHVRRRAWARLGQLLLRGGRWDGPAADLTRYVAQDDSGPAAVNNAYGFLVWLNRGGTLRSLPDVEGPDAGNGQLIAGRRRATCTCWPATASSAST